MRLNLKHFKTLKTLVLGIRRMWNVGAKAPVLIICLVSFGDSRTGCSPTIFVCIVIAWDNAVAQLVEALRYKSEGRGFESRWCHWNFSLT
jgi:hypothetical protein